MLNNGQTNSSVEKYWSFLFDKKHMCVYISLMACCKRSIGESLAKVVAEFSPITIFQPVRVFRCSSAKFFQQFILDFYQWDKTVSIKFLLSCYHSQWQGENIDPKTDGHYIILHNVSDILAELGNLDHPVWPPPPPPQKLGHKKNSLFWILGYSKHII